MGFLRRPNSPDQPDEPGGRPAVGPAAGGSPDPAADPAATPTSDPVGAGVAPPLDAEAAAGELATLTEEMEQGTTASRRRAVTRATRLVRSTARGLARGGSATVRGTVIGGRALTDRLLTTAPRIPVRNLATLRAQHPEAADPEALADLLVVGARRAAAAVGAGIGAAAMLPVPPAMAVEIASETLVVAAVEIKLIAELHQVYGFPALGSAGQRTAAYVTAWADRRGIDGSAALHPAGLAAVAGLAVGSEVRQKVRKRLTRSSLRKLPSLTPLMLGAGIGARMNRRDTMRLAARVRSDLRARTDAPPGYWEAAAPQ
ncbi:hypothetical protein [Kitasatospora paranensis]|uniref:EcsC family protein n=1 Tax=Kitasatospora paranensis TaxID=258053 RepID=A0ABW2G7S8_9ACTN